MFSAIANHYKITQFNSLFIFDSFNFNFLRREVELINVSDHWMIGLDVHQNEWRHNVYVCSIKCACCRAGIYVEFILMFVRLKLVSVPRYQDVNVKLSLNESECFWISVWNYLMAMTETDSELSDSHDFLLWICEILEWEENGEIQLMSQR